MKIKKVLKYCSKLYKRATKLQRENNFISNLNINGVDNFRVTQVCKFNDDKCKVYLKPLSLFYYNHTIYSYIPTDNDIVNNLYIDDIITVEFKIKDFYTSLETWDDVSVSEITYAEIECINVYKN